MAYQNQRVLVAEDEEGLRHVLTRQLELSGFPVDSAADGQEAIARIRAEEYAVVVTDMRMPKADGLEVMRVAKDRWPFCEVIILTAYGSLENVLDAVREGNLYDYLTKPLEDIRELTVTVERAVRTRQLRVQNHKLERDLEAALERLREGTDQWLEADRQAGVGRLAETVVRGVSSPLEAVQHLAEYATEKAAGLATAPDAEEEKLHLVLALQRLQTAARHSKRVLEALVRYTCDEQAAPGLVSPNSLVGDTLVLLESEFVRSQVEVKTSLDDDVPEVLVEPSKLQQVLVTLLLSAADASGRGSAISIGTRREAGRPPLAVIDVTAPGPDADGASPETNNPRIAVAHSLVQELGGRILIESEPGVGTRTSVRLPGIGRERRPTSIGKAA